MPNPGGDKLCPICDSPLQPGSKKCSFCGTDLTIFEIDVDTPKKEEPTSPAPEPAPKVSVDSRVDEIFSSRPPPATSAPSHPPAAKPIPPPFEKEPEPEPLPQPVVAPPAPEPMKVPEKPQIQEPPKAPEPEPEETFECPSCGSKIPVSATVCPKCGVMFAEEGAEMFQCPACNTLVSVDAKSCPGCGAVFVESEEEAAAVSAPAAPAPAEELSLPEKEETELPVEEAKPSAPEPKAKEPEKKKGGWFKWGKKEEPKPEPKVEKIAPAPAPPRKSTDTVRDLSAPAKPTSPPPVRQETPEPARPAPTYAPPTPRPSFGTSVSSSQDKGEQLARMVAEWKPLFALAGEKDIDPGESKQLIDEAIIAGRERQVDRAIELVQKSKSILTGKIDAHLAQAITGLNEEIKAARDFGGDISRATTYMHEVTRARGAGDIEAAYVYVEKINKELLPITGRYNESKVKIADLKKLIQDCETFIVDTKEARRLAAEASRAFELKDFDKVDGFVKSANDSLFKAIPPRLTEEMKTARERLIDAKAKNVNITPMLTMLKSTMSLLKAGDYAQAVREMRDFNELMKKAA